jgi:hypothetical protein
MMRQYCLCFFFIFASPAVFAEWQMLLDGNTTQFKQYIDLENVKQTGPMAIYRQVHVLSQGDASASNGVLSTLALYEYDCMRAKFRLLQISGFSRQWADGQTMPLSQPTGIGEWRPLALQSAGQQAFQLLCPDGEEK